MTSMKAHNSVIKLRKLACNNPNLDPVNINANPNFGQIPSIRSKEIERKRNSYKNYGSSRAITLLLFDGN